MLAWHEGLVALRHVGGGCGISGLLPALFKLSCTTGRLDVANTFKPASSAIPQLADGGWQCEQKY